MVLAVLKFKQVLILIKMNITKENIDDLNAILLVKIGKTDYEEKVVNVLKDYRKKANMPGFRPGKVPFGLINKMYRLPVLQEEINKIVSDNLTKYIIDEDLKILGDPMPNREKTSSIDWETQEDFDFSFNIAVQPEFELKLPKKDKLKYYTIKIEDEMVNNAINSYKRRFGSLKKTEKVEVENEMIKGDLMQLDQDGKEFKEGIKSNDALFSLERVKDNEIKALFKGKAIDDEVTFNLKKAFENETEIAGLLKISKEVAGKIATGFKVKIKEISA